MGVVETGRIFPVVAGVACRGPGGGGRASEGPAIGSDAAFGRWQSGDQKGGPGGAPGASAPGDQKEEDPMKGLRDGVKEDKK